MLITSKENAVNYIKFFDGRCELYGILDVTIQDTIIHFPFQVYDYSIVISAEGMNTGGTDFCEYFLQDGNQSLRFLFTNSKGSSVISTYKGSWQLKGRWK